MSHNKPPYLKLLADLIFDKTLVHTLIQKQYPATLKDLCSHSLESIANDRKAQAGKVIELFKPRERIAVRYINTVEETTLDTEVEEATLLVSQRERCALKNYNEIQLCVIRRETAKGGRERERRLFAVELFLDDASVIRWLSEGLGLTLLAVIHGSSCSILLFEAPTDDIVENLDKFLVGLGIVLRTSACFDYWLELPQEAHNVRLIYLANGRANLDLMNFDS